MKQYRVWLELKDYHTRMNIDGQLKTWPEIQQLMGEILLECQSAEMIDSNMYEFKGKYHSASDEYLTFTYTLEFRIEG